MSQPVVDLVIEEDGWLSALPTVADVTEQGAALALERLPESGSGFEICVLACNDARISQLNTEFRGKPRATNVLSWPAFDLAPSAPGEIPALPPKSTRPDAPVFLGDVAIALETVQREAIAASKPLKNHVLHLILHGSLHLLGYDHETPEDAGRMEGIESQCLTALGLPDPYE